MLHAVPERPYSQAQAPVVFLSSNQTHCVSEPQSAPLAHVTASEEWLMHSEEKKNVWKGECLWLTFLHQRRILLDGLWNAHGALRLHSRAGEN